MLGVELFLGELEIEVEWLLLILLLLTIELLLLLLIVVLGVCGVVAGVVCVGGGSIPMLEQIRAK